jgi:transcriptional regulator with XRE-family HTH domain
MTDNIKADYGSEEKYQQMRKRMQSLRKSLKLTQAEVAQRAGLSAHQYGEIERGRSRSNVFTLQRIADALEVSLDFLVAGRERQIDPEVVAVQNRMSHMSQQQLNEMVRYLVAMTNKTDITDD